ncbi:MAG TPA: cytochrome c [Candidatus Eisenbacteria bacterium]|nr:cytochrome c [Candidatus Eisenbacteria bacterium]
MKPIRTISIAWVAAALTLGAVALAATAPAKKAATRTTAKTAAKGARTPSASAKAKMIERGKFLTTVSGCNDCHTPGTMFGQPDFSRQLSGSELGWNGPWGTSYARNLTPDLETGLGYYSEKEIVNAIRGGHRLDGKPLLPPMPWQDLLPYSDEDLTAIASYLKSLPPIQHKVPDALPPGQMPTAGAFVSFPAPPAWDAARTATGDTTAKK